MKVLVCGGRDWNLQSVMDEFLDRFHSVCPISLLIQGGARGADACSARWAITHQIKMDEYSAEWDKYGKSAGYRRNKRMLEEGQPDVVVAFPGGKGTANMIKLAIEAGVKLIIVGPEDGRSPDKTETKSE